MVTSAVVAVSGGAAAAPTAFVKVHQGWPCTSDVKVAGSDFPYSMVYIPLQ